MYLEKEAHIPGNEEENRALARFNPLIFDILTVEKTGKEVSVDGDRLVCTIGRSDIDHEHLLYVRLLHYPKYKSSSRIGSVKMPVEPVHGVESWQQTLICSVPATVEVVWVMHGWSGGPVMYQISTLGELR